MKVGVLTCFGSWNPGYALHVNWQSKARMFRYFGQDFDLLVNESCKPGLFDGQRSCLVVPASDMPFAEKVQMFEENLLEVLAPYDVVCTADSVYQKGGNFLPLNQAIRNVAPALKCRWLHWLHSGYVLPTDGMQYPYTLIHSLPPNSKLVYQNACEAEGAAKMYRTTRDKVCVVPSAKDIREFEDFHPLSWEISKKMGLMEKDVVQVLPFCSTRLGAKGVANTIKTFAALKKLGAKVGLVLANANANVDKAYDALNQLRQLAENLGLDIGKDVLFTSTVTPEHAPLPRKAIADLFKLSNLFVFASCRESCSNVLMEARIAGCLMVVNENTAPLVEFAGRSAIRFKGRSKTPGLVDGHPREWAEVGDPTYDTPEFYIRLADTILSELNTQGMMYYSRREAIREFSYENVWNKYMRPALYGTQKED